MSKILDAHNVERYNLTIMISKEDLTYFAEEGIERNINESIYTSKLSESCEIEEIKCPYELSELYIKLKNGQCFKLEIKDCNEHEYDLFS